MAVINVYIKPEISPASGYIYIDMNNVVLENDIEYRHKINVEYSKQWGRKAESFEGYKLRYIFLTVKYDGRSGITRNDILQAMESEGYAKKAASGGMFSDYYRPTEKLEETLKNQLTKRRELAGIKSA